jgi:hypothetical protein
MTDLDGTHIEIQITHARHLHLNNSLNVDQRLE